MFHVVLALVALHAASQPVAAADIDAAVAVPVAAAGIGVEAGVSPLPGAPRSVRVTPAPEGHVVSWRRPSSSGASALTGYVVIADGQPIQVDAATRHLALKGSPSSIAVAALNETGSSLASRPAGLARGDAASHVASAAGLGR